MTTALVADDEPPLARQLAARLERLWPGLQIVAIANNGIEAAERIAALQPDLAFLDIRMPGMSGIEVAEGIECRTRVVFVTAFDSHAIEAFEQAALDYVLKPVSDERLARTVTRLQQATARGDDDERLLAAIERLRPAAEPAPRLHWIRASSGGLTHQIAIDEVMYFESDEKYTLVFTPGAEHLIRTPIAELLPQLDPARFWQIHRSAVVNLAFVAGTRRDDASRLYVRLRDSGRELPVSRAYVHRFKAM